MHNGLKRGISPKREIYMVEAILACVLIWRGRRLAARAICLTLDVAIDPVLLLFPPLLALLAAILDFSVTTTPTLSLGACNVIMHRFIAGFHCHATKK